MLKPRTLARWCLGATMAFAGITHLTVARQEFRAQVPKSLPLDEDFVVLASGVVEVGFGAALLTLPNPQQRRTAGELLAAFYVAVFPGNVSQYLTHTDAFHLNSDRARFIRLFFQPVLVAWAWWSTRD
ncbi:hypothetical protein D3875_03285 [Deinococcus cavernae]|uniref:DoxX family membrane protein n=1 Tax=Deinococcus cavernae TaxID=2320857 RepID=A0A418VEQ2_9DEIO|nr:hypothetical protein [Deinococcus cavernae]RJF74577.1 hypothetical protein D3875_03285 [Deinococcus cavernae]